MEKNELLYHYFVHNGLNISDRYILELFSKPSESISRIIKNRNGKQYLLSEDENFYKQLKKYNIEGANGYMENGKIVIPKTLENDENLIQTDNINKYIRNYENDKNISAIVANMGNKKNFSKATTAEQIYSAYKHSLTYNHEVYLGGVLDLDKTDLYDLEDRLAYIKSENNSFGLTCTYALDTISNSNSCSYLVKVKRK